MSAMNSELTPEKLKAHHGHRVTIVTYKMAGGTPVNYALECEDCYEVLADCDAT